MTKARIERATPLHTYPSLSLSLCLFVNARIDFSTIQFITYYWNRYHDFKKRKKAAALPAISNPVLGYTVSSTSIIIIILHTHRHTEVMKRQLVLRTTVITSALFLLFVRSFVLLF